MHRLIRASFLLSVAAALPAVGFGQDAMPEQAVESAGKTTISPVIFNGFRQHRQIPDLGAPGSSGHGFFHFTGPMDRFTTWYRPRAATLTACQRCAPDPFRPRGFGNMFSRPCDGYRIDYSPYALSGEKSQYGPSYLTRMPDPRCDDCDPTVNRH